MSRPLSDIGFQIVAQFQGGATIPEICERLNITKDWVVRTLRRRGLLGTVERPKGHMSGASLADPNRADRALRKFSWDQQT